MPWAVEAERTDDELWVLSEVSVAARRVEKLPLPDQQAPDIQAVTMGWPEWRREAVTLCPVEADGAICEGLRYDEEIGLMVSSSVSRG